MESRILLICAFLCYLLLVVEDIRCEKQNCIPLKECPALFNLLKIEKKLPNLTKVDVFDHIKTFLCGLEGTNPLVECPNIVAKDYNDYDSNDNDAINFENGNDAINFEKEDDITTVLPIIGRGVIDVPDEVSQCEGSLTLIHLHKSDLSDMKRARLSGFRYANLRKGLLRNRNLIYMESNGNCCWQVFGRKWFRGRRENIPLGFEGLPEHEPKSIKRVECNEEFNN